MYKETKINLDDYMAKLSISDIRLKVCKEKIESLTKYLEQISETFDELWEHYDEMVKPKTKSESEGFDLDDFVEESDEDFDFKGSAILKMIFENANKLDHCLQNGEIKSVADLVDRAVDFSQTKKLY